MAKRLPPVAKKREPPMGIQPPDFYSHSKSNSNSTIKKDSTKEAPIRIFRRLKRSADVRRNQNQIPLPRMLMEATREEVRPPREGKEENQQRRIRRIRKDLSRLRLQTPRRTTRLFSARYSGPPRDAKLQKLQKRARLTFTCVHQECLRSPFTPV